MQSVQRQVSSYAKKRNEDVVSTMQTVNPSGQHIEVFSNCSIYMLGLPCMHSDGLCKASQ
jgi:hypothetical protein